MTERELRAAVATRIAALDPAAWRESPGAPDLIGRLPSTSMHGAFSVDIPSTRAVKGTQRKTTLVEARVVVRFLRRVVPSQGLESTNEGLDAESALVAHLCTPWGAHLIWSDTQRATLETGDWRVHTITFLTTFYYSF